MTDQDRALAFYRDTLAFETRMDGTFGEGLRWIEVAPPGSATTIALVQARTGERTGVDTGVRLTTPRRRSNLRHQHRPSPMSSANAGSQHVGSTGRA